jgi:hypothetical protein
MTSTESAQSKTVQTPAGAAPESEDASGRRRRLRTVGTVILAVGIVSAVITYWLETRNAGPSIEDLLPGYAEQNARQMAIMYGPTWATALGWMNDLGLPAGQAALIVVGSAIVAAFCFHVARLDPTDGNLTEGPGSRTGSQDR